MEKSCAAPGQQREGDGGSPSAGSMAAAPERPGTTGTSVRVKDDLRRRVSGNQGGTVNARMPSPLYMGWRHLFLKGDVLWTVCVVTARCSIWVMNPCSLGNTACSPAPCPTSFPARSRLMFMPASLAASWSFTARTRPAFPSGCKKSEAREFELEDR